MIDSQAIASDAGKQALYAAYADLLRDLPHLFTALAALAATVILTIDHDISLATAATVIIGIAGINGTVTAAKLPSRRSG